MYQRAQARFRLLTDIDLWVFVDFHLCEMNEEVNEDSNNYSRMMNLYKAARSVICEREVAKMQAANVLPANILCTYVCEMPNSNGACMNRGHFTLLEGQPILTRAGHLTPGTNAQRCLALITNPCERPYNRVMWDLVVAY